MMAMAGQKSFGSTYTHIPLREGVISRMFCHQNLLEVVVTRFCSGQVDWTDRLCDAQHLEAWSPTGTIQPVRYKFNLCHKLG